MSTEENENQDAAETEGSMEGLLQEASQVVEKLKKKEVTYVKVIQIQEDKVLVDIGERHEGVIPKAEFEGSKTPAVGSRIPVLLERRGREDSPAFLSYKKAKAELGWGALEKAFQAKERVKGKVLQQIKGGYLVDLDGVSAFLPLSQSELKGAFKPTLAVGSGVRCYILELKPDKKQLVVSRRAVLEEEEKVRREKALAEIKVGDLCVGWVSRALEAGVLVNLGGLEGLIHLSDVAWREPAKAMKELKRGQRVKVKVIKVDQEAGKVSLSLKVLTPNPADALKKRFPPKANVSGKVEAAGPDGAKVALKDAGGFVPPSEFGSNGAPKVGETVKAIVIGINSTTFDVTLSLKKIEDIEDRKRVQQYMKAPPPLTLGQLLQQEDESGG